MSLITQLEAFLLLLLAGLLSMAIGAERERRDKSAGLRTHMLVGMGACLFTLLGRYGFGEGDPTRIASNIVTGIGFLGAGVIVKRHQVAHDLTTAASIWITAAIGMAVGVGAWFLAIMTVLVVWFTLAVLRWLKPDEHPEGLLPQKKNKSGKKNEAEF